jgi:hypothetical protein
MGSVDPGFGTAFLTRVVGEKKAREMWYLCRRYSGTEAAAMGLANICVPHDQLDATVQAWAEEICERSPTAIAIAKRSFNMDTAHQAGIGGMGMGGVQPSQPPSYQNAGTATVMQAAFGPGATTPVDKQKGGLSPMQPTGMAVWVGIFAVAALVMIRQSLPN